MLCLFSKSSFSLVPNSRISYSSSRGLNERVKCSGCLEIHKHQSITRDKLVSQNFLLSPSPGTGWPQCLQGGLACHPDTQSPPVPFAKAEWNPKRQYCHVLLHAHPAPRLPHLSSFLIGLSIHILSAGDKVPSSTSPVKVKGGHTSHTCSPVCEPSKTLQWSVGLEVAH